jgi:serine protease Do
MKTSSTRNLLAAGLAALALLAGVAVSRGSSPRHTTTPVTYIVKGPPAVSPQEAQKATASARDLSTAFRVAAERVLPAVVAIERTAEIAATTPENSPRGENPLNGRNPFEGTPFEDFFKDRGFRFEMPPMGLQPQQGLGSGVIIDTSGLILTNNHVVAGGGEVTVRLHDGREFKAARVWTDAKTDVALVRIDGASDLTAARLGDSDQVAIGDWVLALGQPFGLHSTVTAGIISATHRNVGINQRENYLQTDAAINPGNSGGPLVNLDGEVVGINTAISSHGGGNDGVGFAVPINLARWVGDQLAKNGTVRRAYLGVNIQPVTAALADQFHVKPNEGVLVSQVLSETPAAKAGIQAGDLIVEYAGVRVSQPQDLQLLVERSSVGQPHTITLVRDGQRMDVTFTPEAQPANFDTGGCDEVDPNAAPRESSQLERLGLEITNLDPSVAEQLGMRDATGVLIIDVRSGSPAQRAGLESGMVITEVNREPVENVADVTRAIAKGDASRGWLLLVRTTTGSRFVVLR